jgi:hypothetical protein
MLHFLRETWRPLIKLCAKRTLVMTIIKNTPIAIEHADVRERDCVSATGADSAPTNLARCIAPVPTLQVEVSASAQKKDALGEGLLTLPYY